MDIFFQQSYGELYEKNENGTCETFLYRHPLGTIRYLFIKRPLPGLIGGKLFYDITTPYGYGGPIIEKAVPGHRAELVRLFDQAFGIYCLEEDIICEFVRFHPLIENAQDFSSIYEVEFRRKTTGTNLERFTHPEEQEFSKSTKRNIRKALKQGVSFRVTESPSSLNDFAPLYYETMRRNSADAIYFFDEQYFSDCLSALGESLVFVEVFYEGRTIGASINFASGPWIHSHLSGTQSASNHLSPAYILQYALVLWGKEKGKVLIHDGGGRSSALDDSLFLFKKQFGRHTEFHYYVGRKIRNESVYRLSCEQLGTGEETALFPAYRSPKVTNKV